MQEMKPTGPVQSARPVVFCFLGGHGISSIVLMYATFELGVPLWAPTSAFSYLHARHATGLTLDASDAHVRLALPKMCVYIYIYDVYHLCKRNDLIRTSC